jgi:hypothetical protein
MRVPKLAVASLAAGVLGLAAGAVGATLPASAATGDATVSVVHGIPATPVDVYANNDKTLSGFTFKSVAGPLKLPAGSYLSVRGCAGLRVGCGGGRGRAVRLERALVGLVLLLDVVAEHADGAPG